MANERFKVFLGVFLFIVLFAASVFAQSDLFKLLQKEEKEMSAGSFSLAVSPIIQRPKFHPGALEKFFFAVTNNSDQYVRISANVEGAVYDSSGDLIRMSLDKLPEDSLARWVKSSEGSVLLPPKSTKPFYFLAQVPSSLSGTNFLTISFSGNLVKNPALETRGVSENIASVGFSAGIACFVVADIVGKTNYKFDWISEEVSSKDGSIKIISKVRNSGNGALFLQVWGTVIKEGEVKPLAVFRRAKERFLNPGQSGNLETMWLNQSLPAGHYKALLIISEKDGRVSEQRKEIDIQVPAR